MRRKTLVFYDYLFFASASLRVTQPCQALLCGGGYQSATAVVDTAASETAGTAGPGAIHVVEEPVVDFDVMVKPQGMIEAGDLQLGVAVGNAMGDQRGHQQIEIGAVGEQVTVQGGVVSQLAGEPEPQPFACGLAWFGFIA